MTISSFARVPEAVDLFKGKVVEDLQTSQTISLGVHRVKIKFTDGTWICCTGNIGIGTRVAPMTAQFEDGVTE